jgi:hypothetical protein
MLIDGHWLHVEQHVLDTARLGVDPDLSEHLAGKGNTRGGE